MAADSSNWNWGAASSSQCRCDLSSAQPSLVSSPERRGWRSCHARGLAAPQPASQLAEESQPIKPEKKVSLFSTLKSFSSTSLRQKSSSNASSCIYQQSTMILLIVATFTWTLKRHVPIIIVVQSIPLSYLTYEEKNEKYCLIPFKFKFNSAK